MIFVDCQNILARPAPGAEVDVPGDPLLHAVPGTPLPQVGPDGLALTAHADLRSSNYIV